MSRQIDGETDFEALAERVRTQSGAAPGSDTARVTIRSLEEVRQETLAELLETAEADATDPDSLVFVLSRTNAELLVDRSSLEGPDDLEGTLGRPVQVERGMPDDTILLLDPDAVDGEELLDPGAVACGIVGTDR